jgi:hypothetical protein
MNICVFGVNYVFEFKGNSEDDMQATVKTLLKLDWVSMEDIHGNDIYLLKGAIQNSVITFPKKEF